MRERRARSPRSVKESDIVAAVDIGASKSLCLIAYLVDGPDGTRAPEIIGVGMQGAAAAHTGDKLAGGKFAGAEMSLRAAIEAAERMAGERVR
ncbi:MAG: hypothetical protein RIE56_04325, partial [Amphiplicatus sp.]